MNNGRSYEIEIYQNFDFHFHIGENTVFVYASSLHVFITPGWGSPLLHRRDNHYHTACYRLVYCMCSVDGTG